MLMENRYYYIFVDLVLFFIVLFIFFFSTILDRKSNPYCRITDQLRKPLEGRWFVGQTSLVRLENTVKSNSILSARKVLSQ